MVGLTWTPSIATIRATASIGGGWVSRSTKRAAEIIWALSSPDVARMLCDELCWSQTEHARWLADTLARTLLPDE